MNKNLFFILLLSLSCISYTQQQEATDDVCSQIQNLGDECHDCYKHDCEAQAECSFNILQEQCVTTPVFRDNCSIDFAGFPFACKEDTANCGYFNFKEKICQNNEPTYEDNCNQLDGFETYCTNQVECGHYNHAEQTCHNAAPTFTDCDSQYGFSTGCYDNSCIFNFINNECIDGGDVPDVQDCNSFNGLQSQCEEQKEFHCYYDENTNVCEQLQSTCSDNTNCSECNTYYTDCEAVSGCSYNITSNLCVATPTYVDCSEFNNLPEACEADGNCGKYNFDSNDCSNSAPTWSGACTDFNGFKTECLADSNCNAYNLNTLECLASAPSYTASCSELDGHPTVCEGESNCRKYDYFENTCHNVAPEYTGACSSLNGWSTECDAQSTCSYDSTFHICNTVFASCTDSTSCSGCNFYQHECNMVEGCSYDVTSDDCVATPIFAGNCNVYDGFEEACHREEACGFYNWNNDTCLREKPSYEGDCGDLNGFQQECYDEENCGIYNTFTNVCVSEEPSYDSDCSELNGFKTACETDESNCGHYDIKDGTCTNTAPSYTDNCTEDFGGFAKACQADGNCSWNMTDKTCLETPTYVDCNSYFGFEKDCIQDSSNCGHFNYFSYQCLSEAPTYQYGCEDYSGFQQACEQDEDHDCQYSEREHYCYSTSNRPQPGTDSKCNYESCELCNGFPEDCFYGGCAYNNLKQTCTSYPIFGGDCSNLSGYKYECESENECGVYNEVTGSCSNETPDFEADCSALSGFPEKCILEPSCGVYNYYSNYCLANTFEPTYESGCSDYNGFFHHCIVDVTNNCEYDENTNVCKKRPIATCNDSSNCEECNSFPVECERVAGCSFNSLEDTCTATPTYDDCSEYNGYKLACLNEPNCRNFNQKDQTCLSSVPSYNTDCNSLNGFASACQDEARCGLYNYIENVCMQTADNPSYNNDCSELNGFRQACEDATADHKCFYDGNTHLCMYDMTATCTDNTNCNACSYFPRECESVEGCLYNMSNDECTVTPTYVDDCTIFNGYRVACETNNNCGFYNEYEHICSDVEPEYTNDCSIYNGFPTKCEEESSCQYYNYFTEVCQDKAPTFFFNCQDYNGFSEQCNDDENNNCKYNFDTQICQEKEQATCSSAEDCSGCNEFAEACIIVDGCSYNYIDNFCTVTPVYEENCSSLNLYMKECLNEERCGFYDQNTGLCSDEAPEFSGECYELDGFPTECELQASCGFYNYFKDKCVNAAPGFTNECSDYNGFAFECNLDVTNHCQYDFATHVCHSEKFATCNDATNCFDCDSFPNECMWAEGCAYNFLKDQCTVAPVFDSECSELNGYEYLCYEEPSCGFYNSFEGTCESSSPDYETDCRSLDGFAEKCIEQPQCGFYNYYDAVCQNFAPDFKYTCEDYNGFEHYCNQDVYNHCQYKIEEHVCVSQPVATCSDATNCKECNHYPEYCNVTNGCSYNFVINECSVTPVFESDCSEFNGYQEVCESDVDNCGYYDFFSQTCSNSAPVFDTDCSSLDGFPGACFNQEQCGFYNFKKEKCVNAAPVYENHCNDYNGFDFECMLDVAHSCAYDYETQTCSPYSTPECTDSSNCGKCSGFQEACVVVEGCSYNYIYEECTTTPVYESNCSDLNGYQEDCQKNENCGHFSYTEGTCSAAAATFSSKCSDLDGFPFQCLQEGSCGHYNFNDNICSDQAPKFSYSCSDYNGFQEVCEKDQANKCTYNKEKELCHEKLESTCSNSSNCGGCNQFPVECGQVSGCAYNYVVDKCTVAPVYESSCSELNGYKQVCETDSDNCGFYNILQGTCSNVEPVYNNDCSNFNGFPEKCLNEANCGFYNRLENLCVNAAPSFEKACSDYNGFMDECNDDTQNFCRYNEESHKCGAPSCSDASNCYKCNFFPTQCGEVTGCSFHSENESCSVTPVYDDSCDVFNFYKDACQNDSNCGFYNILENVCVGQAPKYDGSCSNYNGFEESCNGDVDHHCKYDNATHVCSGKSESASSSQVLSLSVFVVLAILSIVL